MLVASWAPGVGGGAQGAGRGRGLSGGQDVWVGVGGVLHGEELGGVGDVGERGVVRGRGGRRGGQLASWEQVLPSGELLRGGWHGQHHGDQPRDALRDVPRGVHHAPHGGHGGHGGLCHQGLQEQHQQVVIGGVGAWWRWRFERLSVGSGACGIYTLGVQGLGCGGAPGKPVVRTMRCW